MGLLAGGFFSGSGSGGDVIDLQVASCSDISTGGAGAEINLYWSGHSTRAGEVWGEENNVFIYSHDPVTPKSNIGLYQVKWDAFSGDAPNTGDTQGVWRDLSVGTFSVGWSVGAASSAAGIVTVSIRKGTGPSILATALWDGDVEASGKGK